MANTLTMTEVRKVLSELPEKLSRRKRPMAVTRGGKKVLAVMTWEQYESWNETREIMSDPEIMAAIRRGEEDVKAGRTIPAEEVRRRLGL